MSTEQPQIWSTVPNRIFENLIIQVKGRMNYLNLNLITVQYVFLFLEKLLLNIQPPKVQYMREINKKVRILFVSLASCWGILMEIRHTLLVNAHKATNFKLNIKIVD